VVGLILAEVGLEAVWDGVFLVLARISSPQWRDGGAFLGRVDSTGTTVPGIGSIPARPTSGQVRAITAAAARRQSSFHGWLTGIETTMRRVLSTMVAPIFRRRNRSVATWLRSRVATRSS